MSVILFICLGLGAGLGFASLWQRGGHWRRLAAVLLLLLAIESWPKPIPLTPLPDETFAREASRCDSHFGLWEINTGVPDSMQLYEQTIHQLPLINGYVSRLPTSVALQQQKFIQMANAGAWRMLCETYGIRYLILPDRLSLASLAGIEPAFVHNGRAFYDLGRAWSCARTDES